MAWYLADALGGIKLQVSQKDVEAARAILAENAPSDGAPSRDGSVPSAETEEPQGSEASDSAEEDLPEPPLTVREQTTDRALRAALFGILFVPLELYALWLLVKVFVSDEPLRAEKRRNALAAAIVTFLVLLGLYFTFLAFRR